MAENRRAIHAYLSDDALEGWRDFADKTGVSVSGIIEVLPDELFLTEDPELQAVCAKLVSAARKVDAIRRKRPK